MLWRLCLLRPNTLKGRGNYERRFMKIPTGYTPMSS